MERDKSKALSGIAKRNGVVWFDDKTEVPYENLEDQHLPFITYDVVGYPIRCRFKSLVL